MVDKTINMEVNVKFKMPWRDCLRMRLAGLRNFFNLNDSNLTIDQGGEKVDIKNRSGGMVSAPLPKEPRPRSKHPPIGYITLEEPSFPRPEPKKPKSVDELPKPIRIYDGKWQYIPKEQWPTPGEIYVCQDPQDTLGEETWVVAAMGDGTAEGDTVNLGMFWDKGIAVDVAEMISSEVDKKG